jgi:hypothetical protein
LFAFLPIAPYFLGKDIKQWLLGLCSLESLRFSIATAFSVLELSGL